jgi:GT2 family glycosyltransferase
MYIDDRISTNMLMKLTAVIPTRNRPKDLAKAVISIRTQTRPPDELIIIDQSAGSESKIQVELLVRESPSIELVYVHDDCISGLVEAKKVGAGLAKGDIICFLEDDVILEPEYLKEIEEGFETRPSMIGCCGVISNLPNHPFGYEFIFHLFHRGIFKDHRVGLSFQINGHRHDLIPSNMLSGGVSAWRRDVFSVIYFDVINGFHMLEDIDFSTRVADHYGERLFINPNARLAHYSSPLNREILGARQRRKLTEYILFYKKRCEHPWAAFYLFWLLVGLFIEAVFQSIALRSFDVLRGFFSGIREGFTRKIYIQASSHHNHSS